MTTAAPPSGLTFDRAQHAYALDGQRLPSVTQVLENVGIIDYSYIPDFAREKYLKRGSNVHLACEFDDQGDLDEAALSDELRPYVEAWRLFRAQTGFHPSLIEHRGYHPQYLYAGTLDRCGSMAGVKADILLDIKTTQAPDWTRYQLAAYAAFFRTPRAFRRMAVALHADGTYRVDEYPSKDWAADFNVFLAALTVFNVKRRLAA
jgi:hypothetical protein